MTKDNMSNVIVLGLVAIFIGVVLYSDPRCGRGCQTLAQHLIEHGLRDLFRGLA